MTNKYWQKIESYLGKSGLPLIIGVGLGMGIGLFYSNSSDKIDYLNKDREYKIELREGNYTRDEESSISDIAVIVRDGFSEKFHDVWTRDSEGRLQSLKERQERELDEIKKKVLFNN